MAHQFNRKDEGKRVVTPSGDVVGRVTRTRDGGAFIMPKSGTLAGYGPRLGRDWDEHRVYPLDDSQIQSINEREIVLKDGESSDR